MKYLFPKNLLLSLLVIFLVPSLVHAHIGVGDTSGFLHGFGHPISGLDHLLAMVAVGIWAAQIKGKAIWVVPITFVSTMVIGGTIGITGIHIPYVEQGIILSVLILGVFIAATVHLPLSLSSAVVGLFALFHGHAHGTEIPAAISGVSYGIGFAMSTAILHLSGICFSVFFQKIFRLQVVRFAGVAIALGGIYLFIS